MRILAGGGLMMIGRIMKILAGGGALEEMAADQAAISERCFSLLLTMLIIIFMIIMFMITMIIMFIIMMSIMFMMMMIIIMVQEVGGRVSSRVDLPN